MKDKKLIECLFGHHDYSKRATKDKQGRRIYLCKVCKRYGYYKQSNGKESWYDYDTKGNLIHVRFDDGNEHWFDERGNCERIRWGDGYECRWDRK